MATTTNYGWGTPDDTDLVKDGALAIRDLGQDIDTTTKALNPETTAGDIAYRSATANTNTRLALGTAGQVLTVNAGATAPEWAAAGGGGTTFPTFSATRSAFTTISTSTFVKLPIDTEAWDTASCYDSTTNYRFTPNVSGYYQVNGNMATGAGGSDYRLAIYKNGTLYRSTYLSTTVSALVYFNGTTDYVELYGYQQANGFVEAEAFFDAIGIRS